MIKAVNAMYELLLKLTTPAGDNVFEYVNDIPAIVDAFVSASKLIYFYTIY